MDKCQNNPIKAVPKESKTKSSDLVTRERVNFIVDSEIMHQLREESERTKQPMSRIIDLALSLYLKKTPSPVNISLLNNIILYHLLEVFIQASADSVICNKIFEYLNEHFKNYTFSSYLSVNASSPSLGTKIIMYITDQDNDIYSNFLEFLVQAKKGVDICIYLDQKNVYCTEE